MNPSLASRWATLGLVVGLLGCEPAPPPPPPPDDSPPPAAPTTSLWRRPELSVEAVPAPDLQAAEPAVAEQLEREYRALEETWQREPLPPPAELARAFGEMGRLYHAYAETLGALPCRRGRGEIGRAHV